MKTGYARWLAKGTSIILLTCLSLPVSAQTLTWSDRVSKETNDGEIIDTPPFVKIGSLAFSRFANMQRVRLEKTLLLDSPKETLHVFRVWQGGASQGEQLMLLSTSDQGVDVIGPHVQDFEALDADLENETGDPLFLLKNDSGQVLARLTYFSGLLVEEQ